MKADASNSVLGKMKRKTFVSDGVRKTFVAKWRPLKEQVIVLAPAAKVMDAELVVNSFDQPRPLAMTAALNPGMLYNKTPSGFKA